MVEAKDLRIGNLIQNKYGDIGPVDFVWLRLVSEGELFAPVFLTEEWLIKFGFEGDENDMTRHLPNGFGVHLSREIGNNWAIVRNHIVDGVVSKIECDYCYIRSLDHVHQLQNLYHDLTGQELEYENKTP